MKIHFQDNLYYYLPAISSIVVMLLSFFTPFFKHPLVWVIALMTMINIPGFYISLSLKQEMNMSWSEFIITNIILNSLVLLFSYSFLTFLPIIVSRQVLLTTLAFFSVFTCIFLSNQIVWEEPSETDFNHLNLIGLFWVFMTGFLLIAKMLPGEYWYEFDTWQSVNVINTISRLSLSPVEAFQYYFTYISLSQFGFYYLISAVHLATGLPTDVIIRYGPPLFSGVCSTLIYAIVKRREGFVASLFASAVFFVNPRLNWRFSMLLRENFAYLLLMTMILALTIHNGEEKQVKSFHTLFVGMILAGIFITHPIPMVFSFAILGFFIILHVLQGNNKQFLELVIALIVSFILTLPFFSVIFYSYAIYVKLNILNTHTIITLFFIGVLGAFLVIKIKKDQINSITKSPVFRIIFILAVLGVIIHTFTVPREFKGDMYYDLSPHMLSDFLSILGIFGFLISMLYPLDKLVYVFSGLVAFIFSITNFGVRVPLQRLSIYVTFIQTYCAAGFVGRIMRLLEPAIVKDAQWEKLVSFYNRIGEQKVQVIIILLLSPFIIGEAISLTPLNDIRYTNEDISSIKEFLKTVDEDDIILPHKMTEHIFYYLDSSRDNLATTLEQKRWVLKTYDSTDLNMSIEELPEIWRDKKRICVVSIDKYYFDEEHKDTLPFAEILEETGEIKIINTAIFFTFDLPLKNAEIKIRFGKYIGRNSQEPVLAEDGKDGWSVAIKDPSNVISMEQDSVGPFIMAYTGYVENNDTRIGLAQSLDGLYWKKMLRPITHPGYGNPFLIKEKGKFYLFCERDRDNQIVRFESQDGSYWSKETELIPKTGAKYQLRESPVVWIENNIWKIVYTETYLDEDNYREGLVYAESKDGIEWDINEEYLNWEFFYNDAYDEVKIDKILLDDIVLLPEGYIFTGKYYNTPKWLTQDHGTASFYIECLESRGTDITPFIFTDFQNNIKDIDSVYIWLNPLNNKTMIFYTDNSTPLKSGITHGVVAGYYLDY